MHRNFGLTLFLLYLHIYEEVVVILSITSATTVGTSATNDS